jgi:NTE family protein
LVSGVQLETVLRKLSKVRGSHRFDDLPIPFRAVATDLVTGKAVVLSEGELASAMRASMSVPGAIAPARLDGRLLVDGGLTDNLPVGVARSMGADVVIAVNLGTPLLDADQLNSVLGVTNQMVNILTEQNVQASLASLKPTDVVILPQLGGFSAADFDHLPLTVPIGEAAARAVTDQLTKLSVPLAEYDAWRAHRLAGTQDAIEAVDEIRFKELHHVNADTAAKVLQTKPGTPIQQEELDRDMRRIFGTGDFEHVSYSILIEPGRRVLDIDAVEKSWGPDYLRLGLGLSSDFQGDANFKLLASYRKTWLNSLGGEWRTDLLVGQTSRISTEFYQPLEPSQTFFITPSAELLRRSQDVFQGTQRIATYDVRMAGVGLALGAQFTKYGVVQLGVVRNTLRADLDTGPPALAPPLESQSYTGILMQGGVDQVDNLNFPRSGYGASFQVLAANAGSSNGGGFGRAVADGTFAASLGEHTFNFGFKAGSSVGANPMPTPLFFQWGGFLHQSGYPTGALLGEDIAFARVMYYKRLLQWSLLDGVYGGVSLEIGRVGRPLVPTNDSGVLRSGALLLGVDTPLGPLYLGYGRTTQGIGSFYLNLGRP